MADYWGEREQEALYNEILKQGEKQLIKEYRRCASATLYQLLSLYADGIPTITDIYRFNRYYELLSLLHKDLKKLGASEIEITTGMLTKMYLKNQELIGSSAMLIPTNPREVEIAINRIWCADGKHWSSRIWTHKDELAQRIQDGIIDCISRGVSKDELTKQLMADYSVGFNQADRIARTELSYVQGQSTLERYRKMGVTHYKILAAHDTRTCDVCRALDGKIFPIDKAEVGVNYPPLHPNGRCTILAVK